MTESTSKDNSLWFYEAEGPRHGIRVGFAVHNVLRNVQTDYQHLVVFELEGFGRIMVLDDCLMLTQRDEFIYHEMLTHVPLFSHPSPRRVLVVGGGDGGTLREAARHPSVESMVLCEIDGGVIQAAKDFFPEVAVGFDDPRVKVIVGDAIAYVKEHKNSFDVILIDGTDPVGPGVGLYSKEFYQAVYGALAAGGVAAAQGESPYLHGETVRGLHATLRQVFPVTRLYQATIPTYPSGWWSFAYASKGADPLAPEVFQRIERAALVNRYHTADIHRAAFALPPCVAELLPS